MPIKTQPPASPEQAFALYTHGMYKLEQQSDQVPELIEVTAETLDWTVRALLPPGEGPPSKISINKISLHTNFDPKDIEFARKFSLASTPLLNMEFRREDTYPTKTTIVRIGRLIVCAFDDMNLRSFNLALAREKIRTKDEQPRREYLIHKEANFREGAAAINAMGKLFPIELAVAVTPVRLDPGPC